MATGQDGQFLKMDRTARCSPQSATAWAWARASSSKPATSIFDKQGNLYTGDTSVGRVTVIRK